MEIEWGGEVMVGNENGGFGGKKYRRVELGIYR